MKKLHQLSISLLSLALSGTVFAQSDYARPAGSNAPGNAKKIGFSKANALMPAASQEQIDAAERTHFGDYNCEFKQRIHVSLHARQAGYIEVKHLNKIFVMKPVLSSTGALRLEDVRGQTLLLQIANKSMLMDVKAGKRIVDSVSYTHLTLPTT
jgi:hypothetical protein